MRLSSVVAAAVLLSLTADAFAQGGGGRGRWQRAEEITNRVGAFFADVQGPATEGEKVADLSTVELVRAAKGANQLTVLYLHDSSGDQDVRDKFELALFNNDELGIELSCFHCGRIDVSKDPALAAIYGTKVPMFVVFDADSKATEVAMTGYKPSVSALTKALEKAASGTIKPSLATYAKQYGGLVRDLEQLLTKKKRASEELTKAGEDKSKRKAAEKEIASLEGEEKKLLEKETEMLTKVRLPERSASAERLGTRGWGGRGGEGGRGEGGRGEGGRGEAGRGEGGRGGN